MTVRIITGLACGPAKSFPAISYREAGVLVAATHPQTYIYMYMTQPDVYSFDYDICPLQPQLSLFLLAV